MELSELKGLGTVRINNLRAIGINTLRDLLYFFPVRFEDHLHITDISDAFDGDVMILGIISEKPKTTYFHGKSRTTAKISDNSGTISIVWFNEPWIVNQIPVGKEILLFGKIISKNGRHFQNPKLVSRKCLMPVYRKIKGLPNKTLLQLIQEAISYVESICPETLPASLRKKYNLISREEAIRKRHFPAAKEDLIAAQRRIDFENILIYLSGVSLFKDKNYPGFKIDITVSEIASFWNKLPFTPTEAQKRVLREIIGDMRQETAMSRLVQGDVGCGKTILALGAIYLVCKHGFQAALMAPTDILARQHYESAVELLEPLGISCVLLTGSTRLSEKKRILSSIKQHDCQAIFGTHALISSGTEYAKLGLVITDEQHRFGVLQRTALQNKGVQNNKILPHVLVMSATPIPRTLALILYGDLNLSIVDELPPGRKPVETHIVPPEKRTDMYGFLRRLIQDGQQAYIVCPLVEDSDCENMQEVKSAQTLYRELICHELKDVRVGITWGSQKNEEKVETLQKFLSGDLDVLVSTTVIEVGVNVPNATVMIVENAERYGLSQLHQLRGRVGRGEKKSWCFLLSSFVSKLRILCETNDGFLIAQKDLEMRGPGDLLGVRQSGDSILSILGSGNSKLISEVQDYVHQLKNNPKLTLESKQIENLARSFFEEKNYHIALN